MVGGVSVGHRRRSRRRRSKTTWSLSRSSHDFLVDLLEGLTTVWRHEVLPKSWLEVDSALSDRRRNICPFVCHLLRRRTRLLGYSWVIDLRRWDSIFLFGRSWSRRRKKFGETSQSWTDHFFHPIIEEVVVIPCIVVLDDSCCHETVVTWMWSFFATVVQFRQRQTWVTSSSSSQFRARLWTVRVVSNSLTKSLAWCESLCASRAKKKSEVCILEVRVFLSFFCCLSLSSHDFRPTSTFKLTLYMCFSLAKLHNFLDTSKCQIVWLKTRLFEKTKLSFKKSCCLWSVFHRKGGLACLSLSAPPVVLSCDCRALKCLTVYRFCVRSAVITWTACVCCQTLLPTFLSLSLDYLETSFIDNIWRRNSGILGVEVRQPK